MKRFIISISIVLISLTGLSQKTDSIKVTDTTMLLSIKDMEPVFSFLMKLPYEQSQPYIDYLVRTIGDRRRQYEAQFKKEKPKK